MIPYRLYHTLSLLEQYAENTYPLDLFVSFYFRDHKSLGSKDRAEVAENVYGVIRWRSLLDYLCGEKVSWRDRVEKYKDFNPNDYIDDDTIPLHIRVSFPKILFDQIVTDHGEDKAKELCLSSNVAAPTMVRANTLKTSRDELLVKWQELYEVSPATQSSCGIRFHKKIHFFSTPEFKAGLFEVQDEGSQLLADLVDVHPGQLIMDYCSGSGGKTLAFAPKTKGKGQIYLHDIRSRALIEAKKRLKRAGIQNAQLVQPESPHLKSLKKKMDWVLVDAPCSGTGTLRRNPDMKWRFDESTVPRLVGQQRAIFEKALSYVKPGGFIVYGTCSILKQENEEQTDHFIKTYSLKQVGNSFQSFPALGEMDGFYGVVLSAP